VINKRNVFFKLTFAILLLLMVSSVALAQEATPEATAETTLTTDTNLVYSVPVNGQIGNTAFSQTWTLQTASADRIRVRVDRTGGNLIPEVAILDSNNQQLQTGYDIDRTGASAEVESLILPAGGTYQVLVQRRGAGTGVTEGTYTLTVFPEATAEDNPNNRLVIEPVEADATIPGEITATHWYQRYTYTAGGNDVIRVTAQRTSGTLYPEVEVLDVNGTALQTGWVDNTGETAQIDNLELPSAGQYTIVVTRYSRFNGETVGDYDLTVRLIGAGEDSPMLAPAAGNDVVYDTALHGTINARWYEDWKLVTQAGDTITLTVTSDAATSDAAGNLQPEVALLGGSGQELRRGYTENDGATARIENLTLDGPGTYTVRVSRAQGKRGLTSGPYTLTVSLDGSGAGSPILSEPAGTVEIGTAVQGDITNEKWSNLWTFTGAADQTIDIVVERTDGTFIPLVEILDSNGQRLTSGYYEPTQDRVLVNNYTPPSAGTYQIRVYRENEQSGFTSGGYSLLVRPHSDE
jgi:hypothetical protein